jgi:hypothetical protein
MRELHLLVGADHEHRAHRQGVVRVGVDHVVQVGHLALGVADHREVHRGALGLADVALPLQVRLDVVDREADDLHVALVELGLDLGHVAELGGADRREVLRVAEQHTPRVAEPLVEADLALGGGGGEVGCGVAETDGHDVLLDVRGCGRR